MGFYEHQILPRFIDWFMDRQPFERLRSRCLADLEGEVLEVGFGSGLNLPHYPASVGRLLAVEPSGTARRLARPRIEESGLEVEVVGLEGESLALADASVDAVVTTWTLCTIPRPERALAEFRRVLRPGGQYRFVEHGLAPEDGVARWQRRLTPLQRRLGGGCHLDRAIDHLVRDAGFAVDVETFYLPGPRVAAWSYLGTGRPTGPTPPSEPPRS